MNIKLKSQENIMKELNEKLFRLKNDYNKAKVEIKKLNNIQNNTTNGNHKEYINCRKDKYPKEVNTETGINMKEEINQN